jgi:hypothetical protein
MIAKTNQILKPDVHHVSYRSNKQLSVDTKGHKVSTGLIQSKTVDVAIIHHYETKSVAEFRTKCGRGDVMYGKYVEGTEVQGNQRACQLEQELVEQFWMHANNMGEVAFFVQCGSTICKVQFVKIIIEQKKEKIIDIVLTAHL